MHSTAPALTFKGCFPANDTSQKGKTRRNVQKSRRLSTTTSAADCQAIDVSVHHAHLTSSGSYLEDAQKYLSRTTVQPPREWLRSMIESNVNPPADSRYVWAVSQLQIELQQLGQGAFLIGI